jgi:hypothetical protein
LGSRPKISSADRIRREQRIAEIIQLRLQGWSLRQIGESLSPAISAQAVFACIRRALERVGEAVEEARRLEELRLDELMVPIYEKALAGDISAIDTVLSIQVRRAKLLGLDAQPVRSGSGANEFDQPLVKVEVVGDPERVRAEQTARARLGLGPHLN